MINSFSELYGCIPVVSVQFFCPPEKNTNLKLSWVTLWSGRCVCGPSCYNAVQSTSNYVHCVPPES